MIVAGSGARVQDIHGRSYIDAMAGLWCVNVGYGRASSPTRMREHAPSGSATTTRSRRWATDTPGAARRAADRAGARRDVEGLLRQHAAPTRTTPR